MTHGYIFFCSLVMIDDDVDGQNQNGTTRFVKQGNVLQILISTEIFGLKARPESCDVLSIDRTDSQPLIKNG